MADQITTLRDRVFINAPFDRLRSGLLETFLKNRLQPEIGLEGLCLHTCSRRDFQEVAERLRREGLSCTLHAPFYDLSPGASDPGILAASRNKLRKAFDLIDIFQPKSIICHLSYEENKHGFHREQWLETATTTWRELLTLTEAAQVPVMLENTYETEPSQHHEILTALDSPLARFCLDVGHVLAFAKNTWQDWLPSLSPWLGQLHLHDNHGDHDRHLAIGQGAFDFPGLFAYLRVNELRPILTLEPHQEDDLWISLEALANLNLPEAPAA
ncbi:MAG: sugar phosphate isomerase/epimerase [Proteobacteria bacterium]|nr:sugar phosphate isomerase/epimerase [Pseudomonadota bacterium]MBU1688306.1 sugar phosphate isomerase/epimerase [Pseudomonadota bacterium]